MKIKIACVLLIGMCMIGCNRTTEVATMVEDLNMSQKQSVISQSQLKIISEVSVVKRGETGVITIQGTPNTLYNIKTSYKLANKTVSVIQWRTTDGTGVTTFDWVVSMGTMAGTYDATISGGGDTLKTNHRVKG
ncbi:hypothetical protein K2F40_11380 [Clostridium sp. CM028]|uniref:hypothetical protein n=1 Tax=unclassified Clostridium TaxID=2614128 RepID=UPI001C0DD6B0|nr:MULTISPECIES: hypothetical protein [unclassified Clostridium]MBU3091918.1 hypothetical protein [Clostridium sp. CF011]MBW9145711.1 hypothetical protein [Clostridium sp. CM027]MBW9149561.1 hypothetical protein [Clostridium sp. CM028]UVE41440.1 hypothetical protein KTC92_02775 [Clostridium sp. CM027]WAG70434.1 hypothetical protein LL036_03050 [Clostridium sp. CF011]